MSSVVVITPPTQPLIWLDEAKAHLRVDFDDDDLLIGRLVEVAADKVQEATQRSLLNRTLEMRLDGFDYYTPHISLRYPPIVSITSVTYVDTSQVTQTISTSDYRLADRDGTTAVFPAYGDVWPGTLADQEVVKVRYVAGYGTDPASVPASLRHAVFLLLGHLYEHREPVITATTANEIPMSLKWLFEHERVWA